MFFFMSSSVSFAPTKLMSDPELSDTDAQAFFNITQFSANGSTNVVHIDLGVQLQLNAHIDSLKMGYYSNQEGNTGWDYDFTNFTWGSTDYSTDSLKWNGVFLEFGFDNIATDSTRKLNYIDFGTLSASGPITATLNKVNVMVLNNGATGQNNGIAYRQTAAGTRTIRFNNTVMSFLFASKYNYTSLGTVNTINNLNGIFQKIPSYSNSQTNMQINGSGW
jgi:hypothetical protein